MIRKLVIKNFESHKSSVLDFSSGLNVIIGLTDAGKSGIFRALRWVIWNRPQGTSMLPLFNKKPGWTEVELVLDDGTSVTKRKKGQRSEYLVNGKRLTGFGHDVPKDVQDALRIEDINFQSQIDLPFLMFDSPGERSRTLNRVAGLDDIDRCLAAADGDTRRVRQALEAEKNTLEDLRENLKRFDDLDDRIALVTKAEKIEKRITRAVALQDDIVQSQERLEAIENEIEKLSWVENEKLEKMLISAKRIAESIEPAQQRYSTLSSILGKLERLDFEIEEVQEECNELLLSLPKRCPVCNQPLR